jgi:prepilin-type N-terminal cleavage/methylation domain-containing protein
MRRQQRGFSLAELIVALVILTLVITTTLAMMAQRRDRIREASETVLVYQALANEVEYWRRTPFDSIDDTATKGFQSDLALLAPLAPYTTSIKVITDKPDVKEVKLKVDWFGNERHVVLTVIRCNTKGSNLW